MSSNVVRCPKCGQENPSSTSFCGGCGQSLTIQCRFCGQVNPFDTKFCRHCGKQFGILGPGLSLDRALAWREVFRGLNSSWLEWAKFSKSIWNDLQSYSFPSDPEDKLEPWIFGCKIGLIGGDYMLHSFVSVYPQASKMSHGVLTPCERGFGSPYGEDAIIATRCRLGIVSSKRFAKTFYAWSYTEFRKYEVSGTSVLAYVADKILSVPFKVPSPGLFGALMMLGPDPVARGATLVRAQAEHENKATFMEIIDRFFADIVAVK